MSTLTLEELDRILPGLIAEGIYESRLKPPPSAHDALTQSTGTVVSAGATTALVQLDQDDPGVYATLQLATAVADGGRFLALMRSNGGGTIVGSDTAIAGGTAGASGILPNVANAVTAQTSLDQSGGPTFALRNKPGAAAVASGATLGTFGFGGQYDANPLHFNNSIAGISATANQLFSATHAGSYLSAFTTPDNSITSAEAQRWTATGDALLTNAGSLDANGWLVGGALRSTTAVQIFSQQAGSGTTTHGATNAVITTGSKTITAAGATFTAADVGKYVTVKGGTITSGPSGIFSHASGYITQVNSATSIDISIASPATGTGCTLAVIDTAVGSPINVVWNYGYTDPGGLTPPNPQSPFSWLGNQGPRALVNVEGVYSIESASSGAPVPISFESFMVRKNAPGLATNMQGGTLGFVIADQFIADGNTVTMVGNGGQSGVDGFVSNYVFATINGGTFDASTANLNEYTTLSFLVLNSHLRSRVGYYADPFSVSGGAVLDRNYGIFIEKQTEPNGSPLNAAVGLATGSPVELMAIDTIGGTTRTYTALPSANGFIYTNPNNVYTLDFANASMGSIVRFGSTVILNQSASAFGMGSLFVNAATFVNAPGVAANFGPSYTLFGAPTFKADTQTITQPSVTTVSSQPTFTGTNGGFLTTTNVFGLDSTITVNNAATVVNRYGVRIQDASIGSPILGAPFTRSITGLVVVHGTDTTTSAPVGQSFYTDDVGATLAFGAITCTITAVANPGDLAGAATVTVTPNFGWSGGHTVTLTRSSSSTHYPGTSYAASITNQTGLRIDALTAGGTNLGIDCQPGAQFGAAGLVIDTSGRITTNLTMLRASNTSQLFLQRDNGSQTTATSGDLGQIIGQGADNGGPPGTQRIAGSLVFVPEGAFTSGSAPGGIELKTTPSGSLTSTRRLRLDNTGTWHITPTLTSGLVSAANFAIKGDGSLFAGGGLTYTSNQPTAANFMVDTTGVATATQLIANTTGSTSGLLIVGAAGQGNMALRRLPAASAALGTGVIIGNYFFQGWDGSAYHNSAAVVATSTQAFTAGANGGTKLDIQTTPNGTQAAATALTIGQDQSVLAIAPLGGIGYGTGAGGTVTQATNKSTGVTLNKVTGQITLNNASLAATTNVTFTLTDSAIGANDLVVVMHNSAGTTGAYSCWSSNLAAGSCSITIRNTTAGALAEAIVLTFVVVKAVTS